MIHEEEESVPPSSAPRGLEDVIDASLPSTFGGFLLALTGAHPGRVFPLNGKERIIGRSRDADIRIDQGSISQRHAKVISTSGRYWVADLGSTNGTYVNDQRVESDVELRGGDVVRVGETALTFLAPETDEGDLPTVAIEYVPVDRLPPPSLARRYDPAVPLVRQRGPDVRIQRGEDEGPSFHETVGKLVRAFRFVAKNKQPILISTGIAALLGALSILPRPPKNIASFEVRLTPKGAENPVDRRDEREGGGIEYFASAETNFKSPDIVKRTLTDLDGSPPDDAAVAAARARLGFDGVAQATYRGTYFDSSPERAVRFLDRHVKNYVTTEVDKTLGVMRAQVAFLDGQLKQSDAELSKTETALRELKEGHIDGLPDQAKEQLTQRLALRSRQMQLQSEVERFGMEAASARRTLANGDPLLTKRVASTEPFQSSLVDVRRKLGEAKAAGLGELHPEVQRLNKQMTELAALSKQAMAADISDVERRANPEVRATQARLADMQAARDAAKSELDRVTAELASLDKVVRDMPGVEARLAELTRSYTGTKELHDKLFERYKAAELGLELERASAAARYEITSAPVVAIVSRPKVIVLRTIIGAMAGFVLALVAIGIGELVRYVRQNEF